MSKSHEFRSRALIVSSRSLSEQRSLLLDKENRQVIEQVKDDSSSLVCLLDSASLRSSRSGSTDRASLWSRAFEFDGDLLRTKVYKDQIRLLMKRLAGKRPKPQGTSNISACKDLVDDLQGKNQEPQEILLFGPDDYARSMLLDSLQSVFDPAGKTCRYKAFKKDLIRYYLPGVRRSIRYRVVANDEKANASLQLVCQYEGYSYTDESHTQVMDALTTLWKDDKTRQALENTSSSDFWNILDGRIEIDR